MKNYKDYSSKKMKNCDFVDNVNLAIEGIFEAIRSERHMKFHGFATIAAILLAIFTNVSRTDILFLGVAITLVWLAELINSSIETIVDLITDEYHPLAKRAKDIAAGSVLVASLFALFTGYLIFRKNITFIISGSLSFLRGSFQNSVVFIISFLVILVILLKYVFKRGKPLKGGIPSGHSALAGATFTGIVYLTTNPKIFGLALILFILVLQSRIEGKIHTISETIVGGILGVFTMYFLLRIIGF